MRVLFRGFTCLLLLGVMATAASAQVNWTPGTSDFNEPTNWTPNGVPGPADWAYVNDAVTPAVITGASNTVNMMFVGADGGTGTLSLETGGSLTTAWVNAGEGQIFIGGGSADGLTPGLGTLNQSGDSVCQLFLRVAGRPRRFGHDQHERQCHNPLRQLVRGRRRSSQRWHQCFHRRHHGERGCIERNADDARHFVRFSALRFMALTRRPAISISQSAIRPPIRKCTCTIAVPYSSMRRSTWVMVSTAATRATAS